MNAVVKQAIVVNGASKLGTAAVEALTSAGRTVTVIDCACEDDWSKVLAAHSSDVDTLIVAPPCDGPAEDPQPVITTAWLGAKYALPLFRPAGEGILLTLSFAAPAGGATPGQNAVCESIRLLTAAALHDARSCGISLRSNQLHVAADADPASVRETILFLTGDRSRFMSGAELTLSDAERLRNADSRLDGKTILVTGATSGIGRATAIEIGKRGGWVAVGGRKMNLAEETLAMVREAGGNGCVVQLDVTDANAWAAAAQYIGEQRGELHGLINNAGEAKNQPIEKLSESDLAFLASINIRGVQIGMDAMEPLLAKGKGVVLNISSVAGIRAGPAGSAYSATKAAMIGLSKGYAAAYANNGTPIRVNSVQPGLIWSDSVADSLGEEGARQFRAMIEPKTPIGRVGVPDEVAESIAYLLTDAAGPITGQAVNVSGGLELGWP